MIFFLLIFFVLGSAVGSFLNVVIDRSIRNETIFGRSYCDWCKQHLSSLDLVPILSFLVLGGRCRYCHRRLSYQYPVVETVVGALFAFAAWQIQTTFSTVTLAYHLFLISILAIVTVVDLKYSLIPTAFVFAASLVALFYNYFFLPSNVFIDHVFAAFGAVLFFGSIVLLTRGRGMGTGDIILGFLIGMVLGAKAAILAIFTAFLVGAIVSLVLVAVGKKHFGQTVPFGPFLILGLLIGFYFSERIIDWYLMLY